MQSYINEVLRPLLQGDGGEMQFLSREGNEVKVLIRGECSKCGMLQKCLFWCENRIKEDLDETVKLIPVIKKPFFWDK